METLQSPSSCSICSGQDFKICSCSFPLYKIQKNEIYGRYLVAAIDISPGTIIMNEPPIMIGPKKITQPICLGCHHKILANSEKYYCSKCLIFPMCSVECESIPIHAENECAVFSTRRPNIKPISNFEGPSPAYECIIILRLLLLKQKNPDKWKKLINMEHQSETRKKLMPNTWQRNQVSTVRLIRKMCDEFSDEDIHNVIGYYDINSFELLFKKIEICGLFDNTFYLAHDCVPNTHISFTEDFHMVIRAAIPIEKGEIITTIYGNGMEGTIERQTYLRESKLFDCTCQRCIDPTELATHFSSVKCRRESGTCLGYLLPPVWSCVECTTQYPQEEISELTKEIKEQLTKALPCINNATNIGIKYFENLLIRYSGPILHPNHFLVIEMEGILLTMYGRMKEFNLDVLKRMETLGRHILSILDVFKPGMSRARGEILYKLQMGLYFIAKKRIESAEVSLEGEQGFVEVMNILEECRQIFLFDSTNTTHGSIARILIPRSIASLKQDITCNVE